MATRVLADFLPIVAARMRGGTIDARYAEPELVSPVDLCTARGELDPAARGWARRPLVRANLAGPWLRRKRWNFWNWIDPDFVLTATLADLDYASLCSVGFLDLVTGEEMEATSIGRPGRFALPEHVDAGVAFHGRRIEIVNEAIAGGRRVRLRARTRRGEIAADFDVQRPAAHESLTVVVPWTRRRFQLNTKENGLPCSGEARVGERRLELRPERCHGVQDFGRGVWPWRSFWNWGVASGTQDGVRVGVNLGGKWTTGTGANENALCVDGRLHKVMEDLRWEYDAERPLAPWRVQAPLTGALDLEFEPSALRRVRIELGLLATRGFCAFGRWRGVVLVEGRRLAVRDLPGWAEEFAHRW